MEKDNAKLKNKIAIIISPNYKDYAKKYLAECVASVKKQDYAGEMKIFIVDNETSKESYACIKNIIETPYRGGASLRTQIIRNKNNDGFAKGNNDAIKLALEQGFDYIILFNMDTVVETDCIRKMVEAIKISNFQFLISNKIQNSKFKIQNLPIGAVQARIMLWPEKNKINSLGNATHFLGFGYSLGYGEEFVRLPRRLSAPRNDNVICYPSGAAVLFTKEALGKVGLFDEEYWMYNEDQDLGWRIWLAGYSCVLAEKAVVYHKYQFSRSIKQFYYLDRNRIITILKNYHWLTLVLILPAFLVMEIGLIFFALLNKQFKSKMAVYKYFLSKKNWQYIFAKRAAAQSLRRIKDSAIINLFSGKIWYQEVASPALKVANLIFNLYWQIIKLLIKW
ncbi:glycosyltransferase family 2 protein [Candidatus Parcubacteria bacterium]|nr:glycosyltransferase family 2 protein [Candidatus Parcubacteria bacterium]